MNNFNIQEFVKQNWVALLPLFIALIGSTPGIITIRNHFRQKSIFKYTGAGVIFGKCSNNKTCMLLLSGTITNAGDKSLVPDFFDLEVKIKKKWSIWNKWNKMNRALIPENSQFNSNNQNIKIEKPWESDLQKIKTPITQTSPLYGHLMFTHNTLQKEIFENNPIIYKIICTDIYNKKYTTKFTKFSDIVFNNNNELVSPKHGINVRFK